MNPANSSSPSSGTPPGGASGGGSGGGGNGGGDQRRQHRIGVSLEVRVKGHSASGAELSETTSSADVSRGGCSFPSFHEYPVGSELEIEIYRRTASSFTQAPFLTRGEVMRQFAAEDGSRMTGVRFTGPHFPTYSSEGV